MGRSKSIPQRNREHHDGQRPTHFMGRKALSDDTSLEAVHWMLTEEVVVPDRSDVLDELQDLVDSSDDEEAPSPRNKRKRKKKKPRRLQKHKKCTKNENSKQVRFVDQQKEKNDNEASSSLTYIIPPPEIQIIQRGDKESVILLHAYQGEESRQRAFALATVTLSPQVAVLFDVAGKKKNSSTARPHQFFITTEWGAIGLARFFLQKTTASGKDFSSSFVPAFGRSVARHQSLSLDLVQRMDSSSSSSSSSSTNWELQVGLTEKAFALCRAIPVNATLRQRWSKRWKPVNDLHQVLAGLFPDSSLVASAACRRHQSTKPASLITAKRVYALTDNVQLQRRSSNAQSDRLLVPGLLPQLRPYQESAVRWMLERERGSGQEDDYNSEWKLAWVLLKEHGVIESLMDQKIYLKEEPLLLFCPFTGWIAKSFQQARDMTVSTAANNTTGGILAESMGLGKTVEVLACILANPRCLQDPTPSIIRTSTLTKRKIDFSDKPAAVVPDEIEKEPSRGVGIVSDMTNFGDMEVSDGEEVVSKEPPATPKKKLASACVPVTPDKPSEDQSVEEKWVDEDTIGSCICSSLIAFSRVRKKEPIVLCEGCDEPMHVECASFESDTEMMRRTKPRRLRQRFSNREVECRVCDESYCPCCVTRNKKELIPSSATLIVTPAAILNQWIREIKRHTGPKQNGKALSIVVYDGIHHICNSPRGRRENMKYIHPRNLASADVVLMTFDALMADLGHSDDNKYAASTSSAADRAQLRARKKYRVVPSPLQAIHWWRVCLDEAQRVETPTARSAQMALKLEAEHRWCVSGTPVGRGKLEDIYGLLLFLRIEPFCYKPWFAKCFDSNHHAVDERISHLLRNIFWRSTKASPHVREQMGVPEQTEKRVVLQFSSIEKHFYNRQLEETLSTASDVAVRERSGKKRKASQLNLLAEHLHRLRAACCHPQVGSSGIGQVAKRRAGVPRQHGATSEVASLGSRVMSMSQILDRFIEDARQKCEEAQRLAILHTNGMAAVSKLKVEAKSRGVKIDKSDAQLLLQSCNLYKESLRIGEENGLPSLALGDAEVTGSVGFQLHHQERKAGVYTLEWKLSRGKTDEVWAKIDFDGPARKLTQLRVRSTRHVPDCVTAETSERFQWNLCKPKDVVFQVSSAAAGGEFVDVVRLTLPNFGDGRRSTSLWVEEGGFLTNKSKCWRVAILNFHDSPLSSQKPGGLELSIGAFMGLEMELYEADIANDPLQRLHCLHNGSQSLESLLDLPGSESAIDREDLNATMSKMKNEEEKIESLYMGFARSIHTECQRRLREELSIRQKLETELVALCSSTEKPSDCWDDKWWDDFLVAVHLNGSEDQERAVCERVLQDMDGFLHNPYEIAAMRDGLIPFPEFGDINGLRTAMQLRIEGIRHGLGGRTVRKSRAATRASEAGPKMTEGRDVRFRCPRGAHKKCIDAIVCLSDTPDEAEKFENRHCKVCKADWGQTGPICRHCKIGEDLEDLNADRVTILLLNSLYSILKGPMGTSLLKKTGDLGSIVERAKICMDIVQSEKRERTAAWRHWRAHLDLLNDFDELNQCKSTMRLSYEAEDLTELPEEYLNAIVVPIDVNARYHDHAAKQAMALGDLRRAKDTLRYLKNQSIEQQSKGDSGGQDEKDDEKQEQCAVCLSDLGTERAVLRCGHSFHMTPCLENLQARSRMIACPMRCKLRTDAKDVMIATSKRGDDGTRSRRSVKGSWGTKVTRLIADVLDIRDLGEKGVVFSQWEDMLDIVQLALVENDVNMVRASGRQIGTSTDTFLRQEDCTVLLLNVKNGAEGLTLLEATHVFIVEPLLNCGLDSQAINRVCRIGQNKRTFVHRYLIKDTIEIKIDRLRADHQEEQEVEDAILESKKTSTIRAGGIDGGFQSQEELLQILQP